MLAHDRPGSQEEDPHALKDADHLGQYAAPQAFPPGLSKWVRTQGPGRGPLRGVCGDLSLRDNVDRKIPDTGEGASLAASPAGVARLTRRVSGDGHGQVRLNGNPPKPDSVITS